MREGRIVCPEHKLEHTGKSAGAAVLGFALPFMLRLFRLEPRVAAGPTVLMIGDVIATTVYLGLATMMLL